MCTLLCLAGGFQLGQMLSGADQAVPILSDVFGRAADLGDDLGHLFGRYHLDCVPRANEQLVGIGFFLRDVDAHFAAHAAFQVNFAPGLRAFDAAVERFHLNAIDRTDLQTRLAAGAIIGVDDREFFRQLLAWAFFWP